MPGFNWWGTLAFIRPPKVCMLPPDLWIDPNPPIVTTIAQIIFPTPHTPYYQFLIQTDVRALPVGPFVPATVQVAPPETGPTYTASTPFSVQLNIHGQSLGRWIEIDLIVGGNFYSAGYLKLPPFWP